MQKISIGRAFSHTLTVCLITSLTLPVSAGTQTPEQQKEIDAVLPKIDLTYYDKDPKFRENDEVYLNTHQVCMQVGGGVVLSDLWMYVMKESASEFYGILDINPTNPQLSQILLNKGVSSTYANLVSDPGFLLALRDCYPNSPQMQASFVKRLFAAQLTGAAIGMGEGLAVMGAVGWGISRTHHFLKKRSPKVGKAFGAAIVAVLLYGVFDIANELRKRYYGPITQAEREEHQQNLLIFKQGTQKLVRDMLRTDLSIANAAIELCEQKLAQTPPDSDKYFKIKSALNSARTIRVTALKDYLSFEESDKE